MAQVPVSAETQMLRSTLERFLRDRHPDLGDGTGEEPAGWKDLAAAGWLDLMVTPPAEGLPGAVHVAEAFGAVPTPGPVPVVAGFLLPLLDGVQHPAAEAVANELRTGGLVTIPLPRLAPVRGAWGWDLPFSELMAAPDGVLRSVVEPVVFPCGARLLLAPVTIAGERGLAVVPLDRRGVGASDEPALDLRYRVGRVDLAGVAIAPEDFITGGDLDRAIAAAGARLSLFLDAEAVGASAELLERTVRYVSGREQFGRAIGSFQAVRHKVADMALLVENARALTARAAEAVETNPADALPEVWASRIYAGQAGKRVSELAIQCHGGMGFTWEQGLHVFYRAGLFARNFLSDRPSLYAALGGHLDIEGIRVDTA